MRDRNRDTEWYRKAHKKRERETGEGGGEIKKKEKEIGRKKEGTRRSSLRRGKKQFQKDLDKKQIKTHV